MKVFVASVVLVVTGLGFKSAAAEVSGAPPEIRENECLVTFDRVDDGLRIMSLKEYKKLYWDRRLREGEEEGFQLYSREELERRQETEVGKTSDYAIFRKGNEENELVIEFHKYFESGYIGKPVEISRSGTGSVDYYSEENDYWESVDIEWDQTTGRFSMKSTYVSLSDDGMPEWVDQNVKYIGEITCEQRQRPERSSY
jgi:hypothetical protein